MENKKTVGFQIKTISNLIKRRIDEIITYNDDDITGMQGWMIGYLYNNSAANDIFQRDLEKEFQIRRSTATGILQLLEKKQYIERVSVEQDARLKKIVLTKKAKEIHERIETKIDEFDKKLEKDLTKEELDTFYKVIEKLKKNLE